MLGKQSTEALCHLSDILSHDDKKKPGTCAHDEKCALRFSITSIVLIHHEGYSDKHTEKYQTQHSVLQQRLIPAFSFLFTSLAASPQFYLSPRFPRHLVRLPGGI